MHGPRTTRLLKRFGVNHVGRDFGVGDIRGCSDAELDAMASVDFDETSDRLFSVGDIVGRGPFSEESVDWIAKPWFHAVRWNHEQMALKIAVGRHNQARYAANGGQWILALSPARLKLVAAVLGTLPVAIEIEHPLGVIGLVHAGVPGGDWTTFTEKLQQPLSEKAWHKIAKGALWNRSRFEFGNTSGVPGAAPVCVGHSPTSWLFVPRTVAFVDTCAMSGGKLMLVTIGSLLARVAQQDVSDCSAVVLA